MVTGNSGRASWRDGAPATFWRGLHRVRQQHRADRDEIDDAGPIHTVWSYFGMSGMAAVPQASMPGMKPI
jgi:hypothetical protein